MVLQRRFAYLGHELAVLLKERGVDSFCGYVHMRESFEFLKNQTDISYTSLVLDEDIQKSYVDEKLDLPYLRQFESEHGSLWDFISVDRVIRHGQLVREYPFDRPPFSYEDILRITQAYAKQLTAFIEKEKPDFIFAYQPGALGTLVLYAIAKKRGIPTLTVVPSVTKNLAHVSERYDRLSWVEEKYRENLEKEPAHIARYEDAKKMINEFRERPVVYSTVYSSLIKHGKMRQFEFLHPKRWKSSLSYVRLLFSQRHGSGEAFGDYTSIHPYWYIFDRIKRKLRNLRGVDDLYDEYDANIPFVFFPLHFEPELSILLLSPFDTNQIEIVKRLARSVTAGMYVYVKEHPQMTPFRPRSWYEELKKIPNVKLLRPELSSFDIIRASQLVAIITGSAGWEATILGKPVITFGEVFYNALPSVARSDRPQDLPALVEKQLTHPIQDEPTVRFVAALLEDGAQCDLLKIWEKTDRSADKREGLKDFADLIAKKAKIVTAHAN